MKLLITIITIVAVELISVCAWAQDTASPASDNGFVSEWWQRSSRRIEGLALVKKKKKDVLDEVFSFVVVLKDTAGDAEHQLGVAVESSAIASLSSACTRTSRVSSSGSTAERADPSASSRRKSRSNF